MSFSIGSLCIGLFVVGMSYVVYLFIFGGKDKMKKCKSCNEIEQDNNEFCSFCGSEL